jgi:hypothetical protein
MFGVPLKMLGEARPLRAVTSVRCDPRGGGVRL